MAKTPIKHPNLQLTDEDWDKLETLSALGFSHDHIATYFDINKTIFRQIASDENSYLAERLHAGKLKQDMDERLALSALAATGDVPAQKQLFEIKRTRAFKISKMDIFGGFESKKILNQLNDYIQSGGKLDVSVEEQIYIDALIFMRDMDGIYGRRAAVEFFVNHFKLKHQRASEMYDEAINLFFGDRTINKKALRQKFADQLEQAAQVVAMNAETSKDWEIYGKLKVQAGHMLELDKQDPEKLPADAYLKPVNVYTLTPELVGLPSINRNILAAEIDALDQPEAVKATLREDAMIDEIDFQTKLERVEKDFSRED